MRPPESFSTAAAKRFIHSCCVSLIVAVLSFITMGLPCAKAGVASPASSEAIANAKLIRLKRAVTYRCLFINSFPLSLRLPRGSSERSIVQEVDAAINGPPRFGGAVDGSAQDSGGVQG